MVVGKRLLFSSGIYIRGISRFPYDAPKNQAPPPLATTHLATAIMPTNTTSNSNTQSSGKPKPTLNSLYASFGGWQNFLLSYGLKPYDDDDVEEGRRIAQELLKNNLEEWEASMKA